MENFDKYKENLLSVGRKKILNISKSKEDNKKFEQAIIIDILEPRESRKGKQAFLPHDFFYSFLFNGFGEIILTFERLQDLETYISYFPKTKTSLAKINYLCLLIENHLNEIYILKERLVKYFKKIEDFYKGDCRYTSVKNKCQQLINTVEYSVKNIKGLRHGHTHKFRYSDKDIKRLETLSLHEEFLNESKKILPTHTIPFIPNFKTKYRKVRNKWKKIFKKNNEDIKIVLNYCFKEINAIIFPGDGEISYPKKHGSIKE
jgi:hypothetical protein